MDEPIDLLLPYILAAKALKHVTQNEGLRILDGIVLFSVRGKARTEPLINLNDGGRFLVAWVRRAAGFALAALTIALFLINLRRTAERAGRAAERLDNLKCADAIHRLMLDAAARRPRSRDAPFDRLRGGEF